MAPKNLQVIFLRHAEKPTATDRDLDVSGEALGDDFIGLSPAGWERARKLPKILLGNHIIKYPQKVRIFAMKQNVKKDGSGRSRRPLETVLFLADALSLGINTDCGKEDFSFVQNVMNDSSYRDSTVVICWEHKDLADMIMQAFRPRIAGVSDESIYEWKKDPARPSFAYSKLLILDYAADGGVSLQVRDQDDLGYCWSPGH